MTLYKAGGVLVAVLGIMTVMGGLALSGRTFAPKSGGAAVAAVSGGVQEVTSVVSANAYQPIIVQKGVPVKWVMDVPASQLNGCNNGIIIPELGIEKKLTAGKNEISFTPQKSGAISFTCWMGMISSSILVVDNITSAEAAALPAAGAANTGGCGRFGSGGCCGQRNLQQ